MLQNRLRGRKLGLLAIFMCFIVGGLVAHPPQTADAASFSAKCHRGAAWYGRGDDNGTGWAALTPCDQEEPASIISFSCSRSTGALEGSVDFVPSASNPAPSRISVSVDGKQLSLKVSLDNTGMYETLNFKLARDHPLIGRIMNGKRGRIRIRQKTQRIHLKGSDKAMQAMLAGCGFAKAAAVVAPSRKNANETLREVTWRPIEIEPGSNDPWQLSLECFKFFSSFRNHAFHAIGRSRGCAAGATAKVALDGCLKRDRNCRLYPIASLPGRPPEHAACAAKRRKLSRIARRFSFRFSKRENITPGESIRLEWSAPRVKEEVFAYIVVDKDVETSGSDIEVFSGPSSSIKTFYPSSMHKPGYVVRFGPRRKSVQGQVRFRPVSEGRLNFTIQLAMEEQKVGEQQCASEFITLPVTMEYNVEPKGRYAEARSCHLSDDNSDAAPLVRVSARRRNVRIGQGLLIRWALKSRLRSGCKTPLYLMFSMPERVRFSGKGFVALSPGTPGPYGLKTEIDRTRVFVPLSNPAAGKVGKVTARIFQAQRFPVKWSLVEIPAWTNSPLTTGDFDGANPRIKTAPGNLLTVRANPGQPSIVVQNRQETTDPLRIVQAGNANFDLHVFADFYRVIDRVTGELIVQRDGKEPGFSATSRFVSAISDKQSRLEIVDLFTGEVVVRFRGGTYVSQSMLGLAWGRNDSFVLYSPILGSAELRNILVDGEEFDIAGTGYKQHQTALSRVYVDLEAFTLVYEQTPDSERPIWTSLLNSDQTTLKNGLATVRTEVGGVPTVLPKFARDTFRWHMGTDTRFQFFSNADYEETVKLPSVTLAGKERSGKIEASQKVPRAETRLASADFAKSRATIAGQSVDPGTIISRVSELTGLKVTENAAKLYEGGQFLKQNYFIQSKAPIRPDEALGKALLEHINSAEFQTALVAWRNSKRQKFTLDNAPTQFSCEHYDGDGPHTARFALPGRIMARTAFRIGETRYWLLQQDCWGGSGWRAVQLGLFVKRTGKLPEYLPLDLDEGSDDLGVNSGGIAKGWLTTDRVLMVALPNRSLLLYDVAKKRRIALVEGIEGTELAAGLYLTPNRRKLVKVDSDGGVSVFPSGTNKPLLKGFSFDDELVLYTSAGYYAATPEGAHFVYMKFPGVTGLYTFHQFAKALQRPDIVKSVLAGKDKPEKPQITLPPGLTAEVKLPQYDHHVTGMLRAVATGEVNLVQIYQDGVLTDTITELNSDGDTPFSIERLQGTRWISLIAIDDKGIASQPVGVDLGADRRGASRIVSLNIGIDEYADTRLSLFGAARDAERIEKAIASLRSDPADASLNKLTNKQATREGILTALATAAQSARRGDTLVISYAGHGLQDTDGTFYLTSHETTLDNLAETGITWREIGNILKHSEARIVLLLDACQAGAAGTNFFATNDQATNELLAGVPSNIMVFAAAKGREFSFEAGSDAGGSFSKAVADVIAGERNAHDLDKNGAIEVSELFAGVKRKVVIGGRKVREDYAKQEGLAHVPTQTPWLARNQMIGDFKVF